MTELKPCPFCGGKALYYEGYQRDDGTFVKGKVVCKKCGCFKTSKGLAEHLGTIYYGFVGSEIEKQVSETAIEAWNNRAERTCKMIPNGETDFAATLACSACGNVESVYAISSDEFNYCPNCGAKVVD